MIIKCWGSRGSIPVSGEEYIKYGGDTTCIEIRTKSDDIIIIDAGTGIRRLGSKLIDETRYKYNLIFTHSHWDHLMGFPFFKPLYEEQAEFKMYRCPFHSKFVETILSRIMTPPSFPVKYSEISAKMEYVGAFTSAFEIGSVTITPVPISHPDKGSGYKFTEDGNSFVFLTDNELGFIHPGGLSYKDYIEFSAGADLLIHDAEYIPEEYSSKIEWGHSVFTETLDLAIEAGVKQFGLFHLNQERTDQQVDEMVESCRQTVAARGHNLECFAVGCDMTFTL
ncbi:MAG: MBL fold metallo-hydrolase [Thermodesulfobacteriota bacterium]|nr:MAG: MBL fold metallo-hydrolase [Thermodesulfobacteriota bacterium]